MRLTGRLAFCLFLISSLADLLGVYFGWHILALCAKPLIVPSLALGCLMFLKGRGIGGKRVVTLMSAMAFGALGDILLMFDGQIFFLAGLLAFLVGHFFYIFTMDARIDGTVQDVARRSSLLADILFLKEETFTEVARHSILLVVLVGLTATLSQLFDVKGAMGMSVTVYACTFGYCLFAGITAATSTKSRNYVWTVMGYVLFIISDSILATGVFTDIRIPKRGFLVMLTYILAQFLIASSLTREEIRKRNEIKRPAN